MEFFPGRVMVAAQTQPRVSFDIQSVVIGTRVAPEFYPRGEVLGHPPRFWRAGAPKQLRRPDGLAHKSMGYWKRARLPHFRVRQQYFFDFIGRNFLATAVDQFLEATR